MSDTGDLLPGWLAGWLAGGQHCLAPPGPTPPHPISPPAGEILAVIALNVVAALLPAKGRFVPDESELEERPKGALQDPSISLLDWKRFFGVSKFGFSKENELFVGRWAPGLAGVGGLALRGRSGWSG